MARALFFLEIIFGLAFALINIPEGQLEFLRPGETSLPVIVFGGYLLLVGAFIAHIIGVIRAAMGKPGIFWNSWTPSLLGLPVVIWSYGKLDASYGVGVALGTSLFGLVIAIALYRKDFLCRWRFLPLILTLIVALTLDFHQVAWMNLAIGLTWLMAPLVQITLNRKDAMNTKPA